MARTNAQKRQGELAAGRQRQARRREKMAAAGKPDTARIDAAISEAIAFIIAGEVLDGARSDVSLSAAEIVDVVLEILVVRGAYDRAQTKKALHKRMSLRSEHLQPDFVPSLRPDPGQQAARAQQAA